MLQLEQHYADEIVAHALEEDPNECCGILAGQDGRVTRLYRVTNVEHSPYRYSMDGKELLATYREIEDNGWDLGVIYHSHTHSEAYPSDTDVRIAGGTNELWPDVRYILVSLMEPENPSVRLFTINHGDISEEPLQVV